MHGVSVQGSFEMLADISLVSADNLVRQMVEKTRSNLDIVFIGSTKEYVA